MAMMLDALVEQIREGGGADLVAVVLYGSAAGRDYHGTASDQNVLVLLRSVAATRLRALAPAVRRWVGAGNPPPLVLSLEEWQRRADVFAIEYADLLERHRVLHGTLPTEGITVQRRHLRLQLEGEAMGKLLRFRRGLLSAGTDPDKMRSLLDESLSSILALLRATLHLHGETPPASSDDLADRAAAIAGFSADALHAVLRQRRRTGKVADPELNGAVEGYLAVLERLVAHVDSVVDTN